jgi:hypothetical protein
MDGLLCFAVHSIYGFLDLAKPCHIGPLGSSKLDMAIYWITAIAYPIHFLVCKILLEESQR